VATELSGPEGPDGVVLSATVLADRNSRAVPFMPVQKILVPVLVVHHEQDGCRVCPFSEVPFLLRKLENAPRKQVLSFTGGRSEGDPCEAFAHHGFNGLEAEVVRQMAAWMLARCSAGRGECSMCRNIRILFNFEPPATELEIRDASLQFVRKLSGFTVPSKANEAAFERAVAEVAASARALIASLVTTAPPRDREVEARKARQRAAVRFSAAKAQAD
jgi:hypothetical protein